MVINANCSAMIRSEIHRTPQMACNQQITINLPDNMLGGKIIRELLQCVIFFETVTA